MTANQSDAVDLRALRSADAEVIAAWAADSMFCAQAGWNPDLPNEELVKFWDALIEHPPADLLRLAVVQQGQVVGYVDLHGKDQRRRELGFVVGGRDRWGQGLGTRAALAGLAHGFHHLRLHEVWAEALDANRTSVSILERIGMRETGPGEADEFLDHPTYYRQFTITADEWDRIGKS